MGALREAPLGTKLPCSRRAECDRGYAEAGLTASVPRYYWLRARDSLGNASAWSAVATATTT
ncbi:hypothetical protein [Paracoccus sp. IB05]|uniref:hypothetical protein n=1 Tax=Paracoccus sp. IB05 TaxID=2779367 RepID=UPI0018E75C2A|nr:hypothetical protein [Paracoccus sp. IB05]MBJ2151355.1 hypothetical protein [Paracoccus sp. IB05]